MNSIKTYSFYCNDLNDVKYQLLYDKALQLRDFRNNISKDICNNPLEFLKLSKFDCINKYRIRLDKCNNQDISNAIKDVFVCYQNKKDKFLKNIEVKLQKSTTKSYYKVNTKNHKKGELKDYEVKFHNNDFTKVVSYISRYYDENFINYIKTNIPTDIKQINFRNKLLYYIDKFGDRLLTLCKNKQSRVINNCFKTQIEFKSLSFSSYNEQVGNIINYNDNKHSIYNCYITLSGQKTDDGKIHIPVKHNKDYHGSLKHYYKEADKRNYRKCSYEIIFPNNSNNKTNKIRIGLTREVNEKIINNKQGYYGIDVNVKHNLFCDKHGNVIDYDRNLFDDYIKFLKYCDEKLSKKPKYSKLSKKDTITKNKWQVRIKDMLKRKSSDLVKQCKELGKDHIVMEDLGSFGKSMVRSEDLLGFKYSRLVKLLNLSDLKNIVSSIGNKNGIQVTFIHAPYTSISCSCGCIDERNRITQEEFKCIDCGLTAPADAHSGEMIEERMSVDVLRTLLMTLDIKTGLYKPKLLSRPSIKKILHECYDNNG